jgi:hypothetical protein
VYDHKEYAILPQYARYRADSPPTGGYTGGMATIDVYSHQYIKSGEVTAAIMWVSNGKTDQLSDLNDIQAGWAVSYIMPLDFITRNEFISSLFSIG